MFIFFNSTFLPLFALGMLGMPRRVFEYARNLQPLNVWASISAFLLGARSSSSCSTSSCQRCSAG